MMSWRFISKRPCIGRGRRWKHGLYGKGSFSTCGSCAPGTSRRPVSMPLRLRYPSTTFEHLCFLPGLGPCPSFYLGVFLPNPCLLTPSCMSINLSLSLSLSPSLSLSLSVSLSLSLSLLSSSPPPLPPPFFSLPLLSGACMCPRVHVCVYVCVCVCVCV
jgi:hypothetical protein